MSGLLEKIAEVIKELLPAKDASVKDWAIKVSLLLSAALGSVVVTYWILGDTQWAVDRGFKKITPTPVQTVIDQVQRRRKIFAEMGKVFNSDPNVYAIFVINAYDPAIEQYNFADPTKNTRLLIRFSRMREDVDYYAFNTLETSFEMKLKDSAPLSRCTWGAILPADKYVITQTLGKNFDSDWYGVCPILYKGIPTSASLVFYKRYEKVNPYDDSEQLFYIRFAAFNQEVQRIIYAPPNTFNSNHSALQHAKVGSLKPIGF